MKAKELIRYLTYASNKEEYHLLTEKQYRTLVHLASCFAALRCSVKDILDDPEYTNHLKTLTELISIEDVHIE